MKLPELNQKEKETLETLFLCRFATSSDLYRVIGQKQSLRAMQKRLARLEGLGMIKGHRQPPGPILYGLTAGGARAIGQELSRQYYRKPSTATHQSRLMQLVIESEAGRRNMVVLRPVPPSPFNHRAMQENRKVLIEHYRLAEKAALDALESSGKDTGNRRRNLEAGLHPVPEVFRDYYLHHPERPGLVVITSSPQTDRRYWSRKKEALYRLGRTIPVLCVFHQVPPSELLKELKEAGLKVCLVEKFGAALDHLFRHS